MNITGYPLIRLTAKQTIDVDGQRINQGEIFFLVASSSVPGTSHLIRWNYERCAWQCTCPATVNNCRHIKQVSAWSKDHKYSATHPNGCPVVVKDAPPIVAEPKITEIEHHRWYIVDHKHQVFYSFNNEKWHCSCSASCEKHISLIQNKMQKEVEAITHPPCKVEEVKPVYRIVSTGAKRKRRDLLDEITQRAEHKHAILGEIAEIKERSKKDMMNAPLTRNKAFSIL